MTGPTTTGSIDAKLTIDKSAWDRSVAEAKAEARELGALSPEVKIDANVGPALAKMAEVEAVERQLVETNLRLAAAEQAVGREQSQSATSAGRLAAVEKLLAEAHQAAAEQAAKQAVSTEASTAATDAAGDAAGRAAVKVSTVAVAEQRLETAQRQAANSASTAYIANERLNAMREKGGVSALQMAAAEEAVARADRNAEAAEKKHLAAIVALNAAKAESVKKSLEVAAATDTEAAATDRGTAANRRRVSGLQVLIGLAPAILAAAAPIAAGAVGLGVAFGVMGVSGVLAIKGIKDAMEVGDGVGNQYAAGIGVLKRNLDTLSAVSANAMLDSFNRSVGDINNKMPFLNTLISQGSSLLGQMGGTALSGVLNGLEQMNPLIQTGGVELGKFVTWLFSFTGTNGFNDFINYAVTNLPAVMTLIESLVTTAGHILAAFAPLGPVVVEVLTAISDGLSSLPLPVLAGLVTTATLLGPALRIAGTAMAIFAIESQLAVPVVGILLAAISGLGIMAATAAIGTDTGTASVASYRAELERANGAISDGIRNQAAKAVADSDGAAAAKALGIATSDLTGYILGNKDAQDRVNAALSTAAGAASDATKGITAYGSGARVTTQDQADLQSKVMRVEDVLMSQTGALGEAKTKWQEYQDALNGAKGATDTNTAAVQLQAGVYGTTVQMYQNAATAQQNTATQTAQATITMQLQNDAAGILKMTLDGLNGKAVSAAQAQNAFDSSLVNMGDHVNATGKKITFTTTSITDMSSASVKLRGQLNGQVTALMQTVEANGGLDESTGKAKEQMEVMRQQIIDNAAAHGVDRDAVTAYVDNLLTIPKTVPPTKLEIDKAQAEADIESFKWHLSTIQNRIVTVTEQTIKDPGGMGSSIGGRANGSLAGGQAMGGFVPEHWATGGFPGQARGTDTVPTWLTPGEHVMNRASSQSIGAPALNYMNQTGQLPPQPQGQAQGGGVHVDQINIYDQHDPVATSVDVQRRLAMIAP